MPHTAATENFLDRYTKWVGRQVGDEIQAAASDPESWRRLRSTVPVPVNADFKITGVIQDGTWVDPADFEAARSLLQTRYDLKIGYWDLVGNPTLRRSLLESTPIPAAPAEHAPVPAAAAARAAKRIASGEREVAERAMSKDAIARSLAPTGWTQEHGIIYRLEEWHGRLEDRVLLYLTLSITRRRSAITVATSMAMFEQLKAFVTENVDALETIAAPETCLAREDRRTIWRAEGGWADPIDWEERIRSLSEKTPRWAEVFADMGAKCRQDQEASEAERIKVAGLPPAQWRTS